MGGREVVGSGRAEVGWGIRIIFISQDPSPVPLICSTPRRGGKEKSFVAFPDCKLRALAASVKEWNF